MMQGALGGHSVWTLDVHAAPASCLLKWSPDTRGSRCDFSLSVSDAHKATQECPALPSSITLCQFVSAICAGPSSRSRRNPSKTSRDGSPRWRCYDSRGSGCCCETRRAVVRRLATDKASPGSRSNHIAIPTPPRRWDEMQRAPHRDLNPACPASSRRNRWWRSGFRSFGSGSAAVYLPLLLLLNY